MSDLYPILEVQPEWVLEPEDLGSKPKFWYCGPEHGENWLFKYPQANTGQHWAEKIAAEVADLVDIPHAKVELAVFAGERGSVTDLLHVVAEHYTTATRCWKRPFMGTIPRKGFTS